MYNPTCHVDTRFVAKEKRNYSCHWNDPAIEILPANEPCEGVKTVIRRFGISKAVLHPI